MFNISFQQLTKRFCRSQFRRAYRQTKWVNAMNMKEPLGLMARSAKRLPITQVNERRSARLPLSPCGIKAGPVRNRDMRPNETRETSGNERGASW
jgi:hypothetical protein